MNFSEGCGDDGNDVDYYRAFRAGGSHANEGYHQDYQPRRATNTIPPKELLQNSIPHGQLLQIRCHTRRLQMNNVKYHRAECWPYIWPARISSQYSLWVIFQSPISSPPYTKAESPNNVLIQWFIFCMA